MQVNRDFTIEPFKSKPIFRSDKGKKHSYPKQRKGWNLACHGQAEANLSFNPTSANDTVMDIREYSSILLSCVSIGGLRSVSKEPKRRKGAHNQWLKP